MVISLEKKKKHLCKLIRYISLFHMPDLGMGYKTCINAATRIKFHFFKLQAAALESSLLLLQLPSDIQEKLHVSKFLLAQVKLLSLPSPRTNHLAVYRIPGCK